MELNNQGNYELLTSEALYNYEQTNQLNDINVPLFNIYNNAEVINDEYNRETKDKEDEKDLSKSDIEVINVTPGVKIVSRKSENNTHFFGGKIVSDIIKGTKVTLYNVEKNNYTLKRAHLIIDKKSYDKYMVI